MPHPDKLKLKEAISINLKRTKESVIRQAVQYAQGDRSSPMFFELFATNFPDGALLSLSTDNPGPTPAVMIMNTRVMTPSQFTVGTFSEVPAGYTGTLYVSVFLQGEAPPAAALQLRCYFAG